METCEKFRRPRAISCPGHSMSGNHGYCPSPWGQGNSYFRACFESDLGSHEEDSDLEDMIAGVKGNDYSMSNSRAADDDEEDDDVLGHRHSDLGAEDADSRRLWSGVDDNVNHVASFDDSSSGRRGDHADESRFEQDYLDDFESTASGSDTNASFASSTRRRRGGPQGMDDEMSDDAEQEGGPDPAEGEEKNDAEPEVENTKSPLLVLDPEIPDEYLEEEMDLGDSEKIQSKLTISKCRVKDKRVLIRADLNVPIENDQIMNTEKIELALPTILDALNRGAKSVVLMSHMGRPEGRAVPERSLRPVAAQLESLLGGRTVTFLEDCVGDFVEEVCADPKPGSVFLLENLRFHPEEEGKFVNDDGEKERVSPEDIQIFRKSLQKLGDIYVNDAFGTSNRAHSSIVGIELPLRVAGLHLKKEVERFSKAIEEPRLPYLAIMGGDNLSDKIELIENLLNSVTDMIITGGMAFTFLKILNDMEIGASPFDDEMAELVPQIHQKAMAGDVKLYFPIDFVVADPLDKDAPPAAADEDTGIPEGKLGVDIGERTREMFADTISRAETIVWSGLPGAWEFDSFSEGSKAMADAIVEATQRGATVILGDKETVNCAQKFEIDMKSVMWGGASEEMLEKKALPGVAMLTDLPKIRYDLNVRPMRTCNLANQRVGIRLDLDVPVETNEDGDFVIPDQGIVKLVSASNTIKKALRMGARSVVIFSHRGNPDGQSVPELSMEPIVRALDQQLGRPVTFMADIVDEETLAVCEDPWPGSVFLLENLRFHPEEQGYMPKRKLGEKKEDMKTKEAGEDGEGGEGTDVAMEMNADAEIKMEAGADIKMESDADINMESGADIKIESDADMEVAFADQVATFRAALNRVIDVYIMDDINTIDLPHSSVAGIKVPVMVCGPLIEHELKFMATSLQTPDRPLVAILGGDNIQEKFDLIPGLLDTVDEIIIGGALALPFLAAVRNMPTGDSPTDKAVEEQVPQIMAEAAAKEVVIHLPLDLLVAASPDAETAVSLANEEEGIPEGKMAYDIGDQSRAKFAEVIAGAKTIVMGGPMGVIEESMFQGGTFAIFDAISQATEAGATSVVAGNTVVAYANARREELDTPVLTHVTSTAILKLLAGMSLPGLAGLEPGHKPKQEPKKRRRRRKKKKKKKPKSHEEKPPISRLARIAAWIESTKNWKYKPPPKSKLPPLPTFPKPAPRIKYTGAPPPGKSKSISTDVKLFKSRPWIPPPPPPPPPKKPHVPRLASLARPTAMGPPMRSASELPWSQKHKIGLSGIPGHTYYRPPKTPLPCIPQTKEKLPRVPAQIPVIARFDKGGNLLVHVDGTQGDLPEDAKIEVTLVRGFTTCAAKQKPIVPRVEVVSRHPLPAKLVPWPHDYDPNAPDPDLPFPGRYPRLNTTLTQENYLRYRRIFRG